MRCVRPFRGEFGIKLRYHVPAVHRLCSQASFAVAIEEGEQALYPAAAEWVEVSRPADEDRHGWDRGLWFNQVWGGPTVSVKKNDPGSWFLPEPYVRQYIPPAGVVICPRRREYGSSKNWPEWDRLRARLEDGHGWSVFAAGAPDSSYDVSCPAAWDGSRFLDASIQAMLDADLVIATDAGLAHLAVLCGRPLLLITYQGRVAPGPVVDSSGRVAREEYWPVRMEEYYQKANHAQAPIQTVDGWEDYEKVVRAAVRFREEVIA